MIFDIHCHILPNVDDGAKDGKTTKRMLQRAVEEGIDTIVATPHYSCEMEDEETEQIRQKFLLIQKWWKEKEPDKDLQLRRANPNFLGVVLNKVDMKGNIYYKRRCGKYYNSYYGREE